MIVARKTSAKLHLLTVREVQAAPEGDHTDGGGLLLRVRGDSASWVLRYTAPSGRRREMGLGVARRNNPAHTGDSLTTARKLAHEAREVVQRGGDPIDERDGRRDAAKAAETAQKRADARERLTLARAARDYHERVIEPSRTPKHAAQWIASLENHMPAELWHAPITSIEPPALLAALLGVRSKEDSGQRVPETVQRLRQRLDAVFEDAIFHKRCTTNPAAAIRRKMTEAEARRERGQFRALPYRDAAAFMARLRAADGVSARCLEFTVLTTSRTSEALNAEWGEFDLDASAWEVPKERMKAKEAHTVTLSPRAVAILKGMQGLHARWVFPSPMLLDKPLSNMAMLTTLDRLGVRDRTTVHGLARATFSTWANETGAARPDVIEACLAHNEGDRVRAAYNRAKFNEDRAALLRAWSDYLAREPGQVLEFKAA